MTGLPVRTRKATHRDGPLEGRDVLMASGGAKPLHHRVTGEKAKALGERRRDREGDGEAKSRAAGWPLRVSGGCGREGLSASRGRVVCPGDLQPQASSFFFSPGYQSMTRSLGVPHAIGAARPCEEAQHVFVTPGRAGRLPQLYLPWSWQARSAPPSQPRSACLKESSGAGRPVQPLRGLTCHVCSL